MVAVDGDAYALISGALLGLACGDALGAPFAGRTSVDAAEAAKWAASEDPLRATDVTVQALVLAQHLATWGGHVHQDEFACDLAAAWEADPRRGYGKAAAGLLARVRAGEPWDRASDSLFGGTGSLGCGAAMRVVPIGVVKIELGHVVRLACRTAAVTHAHALGKDGAALQAVAVALATVTEPGTLIDRMSWCRTLAEVVDSHLYTVALRRVGSFTSATSPAGVAGEVGNGVTALEAVPAALAAFLAHPDRPGQAIRYAITIGGATGTIAAMAGALAGARCGAAALPAQWIRRLDHADRLAAVSNRLARLVQPLRAASDLTPDG